MLRDISWRYFDFMLLGAVVLAIGFGTTMIRSAIAGNEELLPLINRQIYFALLGLVLIFLVAAIDYRYWIALHLPMHLVILAFLVTLTGLGQTVFGAQRCGTAVLSMKYSARLNGRTGCTLSIP